MKFNRRGFTLVELLVTIVIVGLVIGLSAWGIISVINNSKEKTNVLSVNNIREAARIYSSEVSNASWKNMDGFDAFCITVGELMNNGFLEKDAAIDGDYNRDSFVIVKRNNITFTIDSTDLISENINDEYNKICTGQMVKKEEIINKAKIVSDASYTDRIEIEFDYGSATYNNIPSEINYTCLYGNSSSNINMEGVIEGNKCLLNGLKNNKKYYVLIYLNTSNGSSVLVDGNREYKTKDFGDTILTIDNDSIVVRYNNINLYGGNGYYYFESTVDTYSSDSVEKCFFKNNVFNCDYYDNSVIKDNWYKTNSNVISLDYSSYSDFFDITTKICDESNNCYENSGSFEVYNVKFYRNGASLIDFKKDNYIMNRCIAVKDQTCDVLVPDIFVPCKVCVDSSRVAFMYGWNANMNCEWETNNNCDNSTKYGVIRTVQYGVYNVDKVNKKISIDKDLNLYAIIKYDYYIFDVNWVLDDYWHCSGIGNQCAGDVVDDSVHSYEVNQARFRLKFNGEYFNSYDDHFSSDYCVENIVVSKKILSDGDSRFYETYLNGYLNGDIIWEIDSLMLNGVEVPYYDSGSFLTGNSFADIYIYSFNVSVNNSNYGKIDFYDSNGNNIKFYDVYGNILNNYSKLYVASNGTYEISGNTITFSDGRKIVATPYNGYNFYKWDLPDNDNGVMDSKKVIGAMFR